MFQSLPLLHVAGTVTAERDPQSLQRHGTPITLGASTPIEREKKQGFNPDGSEQLQMPHTGKLWRLLAQTGVYKVDATRTDGHECSAKGRYRQ